MTILDVARHAGVSPATVSRVLNQSSHPVSAGGRRRVLAAARKLAYIPNLLARSLLTQQTAALGVLIPDVSNPYYAAALRGIEDAVEPTGRTVILCNTDRDPEKQRRYLRALMERRVDGLIIVGGSFGREESEIIGGDLPVVMIGRHRVRFPSVRIDNEEAAALAAGHLIALGHRRIVHLAGPAASLTAADRRRGYCRALEGAGIPVDPGLIIEVGFTPRQVGAAVGAAFQAPRRPTAILAANDQVAIGAIRALHEVGLRVPDDVSVVGFDDTPLASYTIPALTTVAVPSRDLGYRAAALLAAALEGRRTASVVLPCELRIRESTAPLKSRRG
ncbi:MAG: LacI family DNA-binding transcriptional regulator [Armatimonadota bacterium]|nr:LacI family DNA-binding transcriptional regulator [Armatimonadota bacterium]MDR7451827.1 LacI family DNA-binding transcriptional regulator [Armatimonadota bacterium]MDR7467552.1 LacI family DNA-binding transcriptional regulator [Armatimonadota bacterium]MDR7494487.1 LacI family DNA-binding transcriptional regulator [Armatimonadota bacterium]MDR7499748.1 LacI family DNA-binding transcriptional regulator [Armatimonadota bacterium]